MSKLRKKEPWIVTAKRELQYEKEHSGESEEQLLEEIKQIRKQKEEINKS